MERKSSQWRKGGRVYLVALSLMLLGSIVAFAYGIAVKTVSIVDKERIITVRTIEDTVGETLSQAGIRLKKEDKVIPAVVSEITEGMEITIVRAYPVKVVADGVERTVVTTAVPVSRVLEKAGVTLADQDTVSPSADETVAPGDKVQVVRVTTQQTTETKEIPFSVVRKEDNSLERGLRRIVERGLAGKEQITTKVTYEDGKEVSSEIVGREVIQEPRNQVVALGVIERYSRGSRNFRFDRAVEMIATGYTHTGNKTYTGVFPEVGTVAVDPRVIPLGTKLYVEGYGFAKAEDIGGAIKGQRIDLFFDTRNDALSWGRRSVKIFVLE